MNSKLLYLLLVPLYLSPQSSNYQNGLRGKTYCSIPDTSLKRIDLDKNNLTISIPRNYKLIKYQGIDFCGYAFKPKNRHDTVSPTGGIYLGNFPNERLYPDDCPFVKQEFNTVGNLENWTIKHCNNQYYAQVTIRNTDTTAWFEKIQLYGEARSDNDLQKLMVIMRNINRKKK